jgi:hypothetical protein
LLNTAVVVVGETGYARLLTWYGQHREVLAALRAAGFEVDAPDTWVTLGMNIAKRTYRDGSR